MKVRSEMAFFPVRTIWIRMRLKYGRIHRRGRAMLDQQTLELTLLEIARQNGETLDRHALYTVRNGLRNALAAKERHRQRMAAPAYQWNKAQRLRN